MVLRHGASSSCLLTESGAHYRAPWRIGALLKLGHGIDSPLSRPPRRNRMEQRAADPGQIDIDLNAVGQAQAHAAARPCPDWRFAAAYSSDLRRAWHTAQIATAGLDMDLVPAPDMRERHFGVLQGVAAHEAASRHPLAHRHHQARSTDYDFPSSANPRSIFPRASRGARGTGARPPGVGRAAFTHGGVLDVAYRLATGRPLEVARDFPPRQRGHQLDRAPLRCLAPAVMGDSRHLQGILDEVAWAAQSTAAGFGCSIRRLPHRCGPDQHE